MWLKFIEFLVTLETLSGEIIFQRYFCFTFATGEEFSGFVLFYVLRGDCKENIKGRFKF